MRAWLIKISTHLPVDGQQDRLLRMGLLARQLCDAGHEVLWWTGTFDHARKAHRFEADRLVEAGPSYRIFLLHSCGYARNVSLARLRDHRQVARRFARLAPTQPPPDVVLSALPTPGLCVAAIRYARPRGVPVVLDVRDLWPDAFYDLVPRWSRPLVRPLLWPMERAVRRACAQATAICGVSPQYVRWGVRRAGREPTPLDRDFPHGYPEAAPPPEATDPARAFWQGHGLTEDPEVFTVCFFGRMGHQFDLDTVLAAVRKLQGGGRSFRFVLCGAGDNLERYRARSRTLDNVLLPGWVNGPQIWTLLRLSSAGLAPYRDTENFRENLTNKPFEYLSAGLPIIAGIGGVLGELIIRHACGVVYPSGDADALASALRELYDRPERRRQMSANARRLFEERFGAERVYREMVGHLERIAHGSRQQ